MTVLIFLGGMAVGSVLTMLVTTVAQLTRTNRQLRQNEDGGEDEKYKKPPA